MKKNLNIDWFEQLKFDLINLLLVFKSIKEETIFMLLTNRWILEDENLFESFIHLKDMINYIIIVNDFTINGIDITEKLEQFQDIDISCYNQMKINNENLKQLKKERRDLF